MEQRTQADEFGQPNLVLHGRSTKSTKPLTCDCVTPHGTYSGCYRPMPCALEMASSASPMSMSLLNAAVSGLALTSSRRCEARNVGACLLRCSDKLYPEKGSFFCSGVCEIKYHFQTQCLHGSPFPPNPKVRLLCARAQAVCTNGTLFRSGRDGPLSYASTLDLGEGDDGRNNVSENGTLFRKHQTLKTT